MTSAISLDVPAHELVESAVALASAADSVSIGTGVAARLNTANDCTFCFRPPSNTSISCGRRSRTGWPDASTTNALSSTRVTDALNVGARPPTSVSSAIVGGFQLPARSFGGVGWPVMICAVPGVLPKPNATSTTTTALMGRMQYLPAGCWRRDCPIHHYWRAPGLLAHSCPIVDAQAKPPVPPGNLGGGGSPSPRSRERLDQRFDVEIRAGDTPSDALTRIVREGVPFGWGVVERDGEGTRCQLIWITEDTVSWTSYDLLDLGR